jgi:hypothetical protein
MAHAAPEKAGTERNEAKRSHARRSLHPPPHWREGIQEVGAGDGARSQEALEGREGEVVMRAVAEAGHASGALCCVAKVAILLTSDDGCSHALEALALQVRVAI